MPAALLRPLAVRAASPRRLALRRPPRLAAAKTAMAMAQPQPDAAGVLRRDVVVVGGGVAAGYIARAFAEAGEGGRLAILGAEASLPYERPALSKKYLHLQQPARLPGFHTCVGGGRALQDAAFYDAAGIAVRLGAAGTVTVTDVAARRLATRDGGVVEYATALVVATGSTAARLPASAGGDLQGVHHLRSEADFAKLLSELDALPRQPPRVACVGGGYIGMEVSAGLAARGAHVTMVVPEPCVMARLFTPAMAAHYQQLYAQRGVDIRTGESVDRIVGSAEGRAVGVRLASGATVDADAVVVGIGARPLLHPFEGALRSAGAPPGGILVDALLRAHGAGAAPGSVFAVGDVAAFPALLSHAQVTRVEHVDHARRSAAHVAAQLLLRAPQPPQPYKYMPYFYSRVFEEPGSPRPVRWVFHGFSDGEVIVVGDFAPMLAAFWVDADDGALNAVFLESGDAAHERQLAALCAARPKLDADALRRAQSVHAALAIAGVRL